MRRNPQHSSLLIIVSANSAPPFQCLLHQRNVFHPAVNPFTRQTLPTVNNKILFVNIFSLNVFPPKTHNRTLIFGSTRLKHGHHFDYWNQLLNMRMRVFYLDAHEGGVCCCLLIDIEKLIRPLQLLCFHLWPFYWLFLLVIWSLDSRICAEVSTWSPVPFTVTTANSRVLCFHIGCCEE
jgi:hypothetical protein